MHSHDTEVTCLGTELNTICRTLSIPKEKMAEIVNVCQTWSVKDHQNGYLVVVSSF